MGFPFDLFGCRTQRREENDDESFICCYACEIALFKARFGGKSRMSVPHTCKWAKSASRCEIVHTTAIGTIIDHSYKGPGVPTMLGDEEAHKAPAVEQVQAQAQAQGQAAQSEPAKEGVEEKSRKELTEENNCNKNDRGSCCTEQYCYNDRDPVDGYCGDADGRCGDNDYGGHSHSWQWQHKKRTMEPPLRCVNQP